jgi:hypothetical protein
MGLVHIAMCERACVGPAFVQCGSIWDYSGTTNAVGAEAMRAFEIAWCARATAWPTRACAAPRELRLAGAARTERAAGFVLKHPGTVACHTAAV